MLPPSVWPSSPATHSTAQNPRAVRRRIFKAMGVTLQRGRIVGTPVAYLFLCCGAPGPKGALERQPGSKSSACNPHPPKECGLSHVCTGGRQNKAQKMWLGSGLQDHRHLSVKMESKDARGMPTPPHPRPSNGKPHLERQRDVGGGRASSIYGQATVHLAARRRWAPTSGITVAFQQDLRHHPTEPRHTLSKAPSGAITKSS